MQIPNAISPEELAWLAESAVIGVTPMDADDLRKEAKATITQLEKLLEKLEAGTTVSITAERWDHFVTARRSIKSAIRNLKKAIAI